MTDKTALQELSEEEAKAELARLADLLGRANAAYHTQDAPDLSDAEYDRPVSYTHLTLPTICSV